MGSPVVGQRLVGPSLRNWAAPHYWAPPRVGEERLSSPGAGLEAAAGGQSAAGAVTGALVFVAMTPCRVVDTRADQAKPAPWGAPGFAGNEIRTYNLPLSPCGIPPAAAYSLNFTVLPNKSLIFLSAWPAGQAFPTVSTLNALQGGFVANAAVVPAGPNGGINVLVSDATDVIIDINGYYVPPGSVPLTGTEASPALTFGDFTTGLYSSGPDSVSIATASRARLTVRADGDVDLTGSLRMNGALYMRNSAFNTALGVDALSANSLGIQNTAIGNSALKANTTGTANTAEGHWALILNTTGVQNTAIGFNSLDSNLSGSSNTAVGSTSLATMQIGSGNTAIGAAAMVLAVGSTNNNTAVGTNALSANTMQGSGNTALGAGAGSLLTTGNNNIYIGNSGAAAESGTIRIGDSNQSAAYIAGIFGVSSLGTGVLITTDGRLGVSCRSSRRRLRSRRGGSRH